MRRQLLVRLPPLRVPRRVDTVDRLKVATVDLRKVVASVPRLLILEEVKVKLATVVRRQVVALVRRRQGVVSVPRPLISEGLLRIKAKVVSVVPLREQIMARLLRKVGVAMVRRPAKVGTGVRRREVRRVSRATEARRKTSISRSIRASNKPATR